ncbi:MAG: Vi polysaccharide biosynthesis UDP-N-acetylglucosamine C-6 dehydrogenase TviB, partial [Colwelliaceae bacterium]|nr:Vi polysaccharide biosynthesis UDP-N-acetylglucosamine C-6 dehydrogenase TviB [Colwelliaceae bacterium]
MEQILNAKVAVIGLGYVGLPLAVEFGKKFQTIGFDINKARVSELNNGFDRTLEVESEELKESAQLSCSCDPADITGCDYYIVTVPT